MTKTADTTRALLEEVGALMTGHFELSSGLHSNRYCQCATLFQHPELAGRITTRERRVLRHSV